MRYRPFKNSDIMLSQLGFGTMRFPIKHNNEKLIDTEKAEALLQRAIDMGINYFDTAWPYHKQESEAFLGNFLNRTGQRDQVYLATKLPCWECHEPEAFDRFLNQQLEHLHTDTIDFYLLHALDAYRFEKIKNLGVLDFLDRAKAEGKIRYAGFSFHDLSDAFLPILNAYPFDFVQIQLNYMDENFQAGIKGLKDAASRGMAVMIMEPLRGGQLAARPSGNLKKVWDDFHTDMTPAALGLKYLFDMPEVTCVLSGMTEMAQLEENLIYADTYAPHTLTETEKEMIHTLKQYYNSCIRADCTGCRYCTDCPQIIPIPSIFKYYNEAFMYDDVEGSRKKYRTNIKNKFKANQCIECGECEAHCPQHLPIRDLLKQAHAFLNQ